METIRATVENVEGKRFLCLEIEGEKISIPMSEDKPKEVKKAFNRLIAVLRRGVLQIKLEEVDEDLFSQVAKEYVAQLNREIHEVHGEMKQYGVVSD